MLYIILFSSELAESPRVIGLDVCTVANTPVPDVTIIENEFLPCRCNYVLFAITAISSVCIADGVIL